MLDRRSFLTGASALASVTASGCGPSAEGPQTQAPPAANEELPWLGLATSLPEEHDYAATVEGEIPAALRGSLVRNGPGLFDREGQRKLSILDGDGMLQCFDFSDSGVRFRNRFTRTEKFVAENASNRFEYATWTTQAPGGRLSNLFGINMGNQAGVSVHRRGDSLYAFDESSLPHAVDPVSLETRGVSRMGLPEDESVVFAAHPKTDSRTGEWIHFGLAYGREVTAQITGFDAKGKLNLRRDVVLPRYSYVHDFFVTAQYVVFNLHPANLQIFDFLLGGNSLVGSMRWQPEQGNQVMVVRRDGSGEPLFLEAEPHWMWHTLNAYEDRGEIVADFVGHDNPSAFLGPDPELFAVMQGRRGTSTGGSQGRLRRYRIDPAKRSLRLETLADGNHEFPIVNPARTCHASRFGYFGRTKPGESWWTELVRFDAETGKQDAYDFGPGRFCGEPIFAADPTKPDRGGKEEEDGWLLSEVFDAATQKSFVAILRADRLSDGPVAQVKLRHHVPLSLHGTWTPSV